MADFGVTEIIAIVGAVASAAGTAVSYSQQANAQDAAAQAADRNAQVEAQNARNAQLVANANEEAQRRKSAYLLGEQRASLAQAGIGLDGSAADAYRQSAQNAELDALNIRYEGRLRGAAGTARSMLDRYDASVSRLNAQGAAVAGGVGVASSLLSGASNAYGAYSARSARK